MATLESKLIAKAQRAIVAHYHLCSLDDDWGTCDEHWLQVATDNPAVGYLNRWFVRVKNTRRFKTQKDRTDLTFHRRGTMCVTFLRGEITDVGWNVKPSGRHAHPLENYQHRDDMKRMKEIASKPEGYGTWA